MGDKLLMVMEYVDGGALMPGEASRSWTRVTEATARKHFRDVLKVEIATLPFCGMSTVRCVLSFQYRAD